MINLSAVLLAFDWGFLLQKLILIVIIVSVSLVIAMYETYLERKVAAWMQDRIGPNRAGPFGILQPLADGGKLFFKEEIIPNTSNKLLFILGPALAMLAALMTCAVIPWGDRLQFGNTILPLKIADVNIGIIFFFGVVCLGVFGIMLGGWAVYNIFSFHASLLGVYQSIFLQ